tara:strand:- start:109 stop:627 length:519 start_codon:yes stop_codon:yes gene_type:complete
MNIIVAMDERHGIGKNNLLPWNIPCDLKYFSKLTKGKGNNAIIMGRKTHDSINRVLPNRKNIVLSNNPNYSVKEGAILFSCYDEVISYINSQCFDEVWVIGGSSIYRLFLENNVNNVYITQIPGDYSCDTTFPSLSDLSFTYNIKFTEDKNYTYHENSNDKIITFKKFTKII